tara:strand:+ start:1264 stop:1725 length:462 start_codon:yes stop_codon:yes gene_type:complete
VGVSYERVVNFNLKEVVIMSNTFLDVTLAFDSNLLATDVFNGTDTGKFKIKAVLDAAGAAELENAGVKLTDYQGNAQRTFSSKFPVAIFGPEGDEPMEITEELPYGSKVRVLFKLGAPHPSYGVATYMSAIRVLEIAERTEGGAVAPDSIAGF